MNKFKCKQSVVVMILTVVVSGIFLYLTVMLMFYLEQNFMFPPFVNYIGFIFVFTVIVTLFLFFVPGFVEVQEHAIQLRFPLRQIVIPLNQVNKIERIYKIPIVDFGSRGYFGFLGYSNNGARVFVQDSTNMVYVQTDQYEYVFSCKNSDEMIGLVTKAKALIVNQ